MGGCLTSCVQCQALSFLTKLNRSQNFGSRVDTSIIRERVHSESKGHLYSIKVATFNTFFYELLIFSYEIRLYLLLQLYLLRVSYFENAYSLLPCGIVVELSTCQVFLFKIYDILLLEQPITSEISF